MIQELLVKELAVYIALIIGILVITYFAIK